MPVEANMSSSYFDDEKDSFFLADNLKIRKTEFRCPKCPKSFNVYFQAFKHIQKYHCVNNRGGTVCPTSPHLVKPIRTEVCEKCNERISPSAERHICKVTMVDKGLGITCLGCKHEYPSMAMFNSHIPGHHTGEHETMFFPNEKVSELGAWRTAMQAQTGIKYVLLDKSVSKQVFHCETVISPDEDPDSTEPKPVCPSTIVMQYYTKGVQVHFYKKHYGHPATEYNIDGKFKKYSISSLLRDANQYMHIESKNQDDDSYLQLKKLMECIVVGAAKLNASFLKMLIGKALEMTAIINDYDEDEESDDLDNKIAIKRVKGSPHIKRNVHKLETQSCRNQLVEIAVHKSEPIDSDDACPIENSIKKIVIPVKAELNKAESDVEPIETPKLEVIRSSERIKRRFSGSKEVTPVPAKKSRAVAKLEPLTQKPIEISTKEKAQDNKIDSTSAVDVKKVEATVKKPLENNNIEDDNLKKVTRSSILQSPSSFSESFQHFVDSQVPKKEGKKVESKAGRKIAQVKKSEVKKTEPHRKKVIVKTRMGQFTPSPKKDNLNKDKSKNVVKASLDVGRLRPDLDYEVKEQKDDCNILILKI